MHLPNTAALEAIWALVPNMRITAVHGLDDDDPTMAEALGKIAAAAPAAADSSDSDIDLDRDSD
jgi:hypothetical protein